MKGLYAIIDPEHCAGRDPLWVAEQVLAGGCAALQLRAKAISDAGRLALAYALRERCRKHSVPFWINDRLDLALLCEADGLHLGQDDLPLAEARKLFRGSIGLSTHSLDQARAAAADGADLIGFGPIFATQSKQDPDPLVGIEGLRAVCAAVPIPVIAIGGIELASAHQLARCGASYAAVIGAICRAPQPADAARSLQAALRSAQP